MNQQADKQADKSTVKDKQEGGEAPEALAGQNIKFLKDSKDGKDTRDKTKEKEKEKEVDKDLKPEVDKSFKQEIDKPFDKPDLGKELQDKPTKDLRDIRPLEEIRGPVTADVEARLARLEAAVAQAKLAERAAPPAGSAFAKDPLSDGKDFAKENRDNKDFSKDSKNESKDGKDQVDDKFRKDGKGEKSEIQDKWLKGEQTKEKYEFEIPPFGPPKEPLEELRASGVEARLARLEAAILQMSHFIGRDLRPDLSTGALKAEPSAAQAAPAGAEAPAEPAAKPSPKPRRRRAKKQEGG